MYAYRRAPLGGPACLLFILTLLVVSEAPSRAELDAEIFAGAHFFSDANRLSRTYVASEGNVFNHSGLFGLRLGYLPIRHLALESELAIMPTSTRDSTSYLGVLAIRGHLLVNLLTGSVRPFLLAGGGGMFSMPSIGSPLKPDSEGELHVGVGAKFDFAKGWGLRIDGRAVFPQALADTFTAEGELLLGFYGRFDVAPRRQPPPPPATPAEVDSDGDGIPDGQDPCPTLFGPRENGGCPDVDTDGDGVPDRLDRCPGIAGSRDDAGCPPTDADNDGVSDRVDRCPMHAGSAENNGCPEADSDSDGVSDRVDRCPTQAGSRENNGCPEADSDNDGVSDRLDRCPTQAGSRENNGCPSAPPKAMAPFTGVIPGITFEPSQAIIIRTSYPLLDRAIAVLKEHGGVRLQITGHTDNSGQADENRRLSKARAEAVRQYMIKKGIDAARLEAIGYGPDQPLVDNLTPASRAKNRRVEFIVIPAP